MKSRLLLGIAALVVVAGISAGIVGHAAANSWTPYGTRIATVGWPNCQFKTLQLTYYDNDNSESVDLQRTGQWVKPTSNACSVVSARLTVVEGDEDSEWVKIKLDNEVEYPDSYTIWWDLGEVTYYKHDKVVSVTTSAGPGSADAQLAGWMTWFLPSGSITSEALSER